MNGITCDKLSTAVTTVMVHPNKYEKDFNTVVTFLSQYINKSALTPIVKVASIWQSRPAKQQKTIGTFKGTIESNQYSREDYYSMSMAQCQQLYELHKKVGLIKSKKTPESSRGLEARVAMSEAKQTIVSKRAS